MSETTRDEIIGEALKGGHVTWDELHYDGPGALEGNHDRPLAAAVNALSMDPDEQTGDVEAPTGHVARVDRWLVFVNTQGFVSIVEYDSMSSAIDAFDSLAREYDAWDSEPDE